MNRLKTVFKYFFTQCVNFFVWVRSDFKRYVKFILILAGVTYLLRVAYFYF